MSGRKLMNDGRMSDSTKWRRLHDEEDSTSECSDLESSCSISETCMSSSPHSPASHQPPELPIEPSTPDFPDEPLNPNPADGPLDPGPPLPDPFPGPPHPSGSDDVDDSSNSDDMDDSSNSNDTDDSSNLSFEMIPDEDIEGPPAPDFIIQIKEFLRRWALEHNVTLRSLTSLCHGLKDLHPECFARLPVDARTLLGTPVGTHPDIPVPPGNYVHIGIRFQIQQVLSLVRAPENGNKVSAFFNIDGLPLRKSSNSQFYPIVVFFPCLKALRGRAFPVGLFNWQKKPQSFDVLLRPLVDEIKHLLENAFEHEGQLINFCLLGFSCDAPTKSDVLGIKHHTGYWSCTRCKVQGETFGNTRVFLKLTEPLRTDADFRNRTDTNFRPAGRSTILMEIDGLDMTRSFVLDPMHLFFLGCQKTMLEVWTSSGVRAHQLSEVSLGAISEALLQSRMFLPCEIARRPREVTSVGKWKATEFSTFAIYLGPVVMKDHLPPEKYDLVVAYHIALTILMCSRYCSEERMRRYARELLVYIVENTRKIYSPSLITHNFHNLIHVTDDADFFCQLIPQFSLYDISAFSSEDLLGILKKLVRGPNRPLEQGIRRLMELCLAHLKFYEAPAEREIKFSEIHRDGPLLAFCQNPQYRTVKFPEFKLTSTKEADSYCLLTNGSIVKIENIACDAGNNKVMIGKQLTDVANFYEDHFFQGTGSFELRIVKGKLFSERKQWLLNRIQAKVFAVPRPGRDDFVFFPLLHTYQ